MPLWSGRGRPGSERLPMVRSSVSDTRYASLWRSRMALPRTGSQTHLSRPSLLPSPSALFASVAQRAPVTLLHCHLQSRHPRPVLLRCSPRLCSPPGLSICLSSQHTHNYSTPMEIQGMMIPCPCHFTRPLRARCRRHGMLARTGTRIPNIPISSRALHPRITDLLQAWCCNIFIFRPYIPSSVTTTQHLCSIPSHFTLSLSVGMSESPYTFVSIFLWVTSRASHLTQYHYIYTLLSCADLTHGGAIR